MRGKERKMMRRRRIYDVVETIWQSTVWEGGTAQNSSQKFLSRGVESTVQSHTMQFLSISRTYPEGQCFAAVQRNLVRSTKQIIGGRQ